MIVSRETYERHGWADGRLGQAYDLIEDVLLELPDNDDVRRALKKLADSIEDCDAELENACAAERVMCNREEATDAQREERMIRQWESEH